MAIVAYSLLWVMQDLYHQPYQPYFGLAGEALGSLAAFPRSAGWQSPGLQSQKLQAFGS